MDFSLWDRVISEVFDVEREGWESLSLDNGKLKGD